MKPPRILPAAMLALAAALAQPATAPRIAAHLTANSLKADVSFLASDALEGRATPSRGLDIAAEYIASQFRRAGLEPAGDDGYFETAPYITVDPNLEGLELTFESGGRTIHVDKNAIAIQEAAAVDLVHAPVLTVILNKLNALDALTPDQVRGKVLVIVSPSGGSRSPRRGLRTAIDRLGPVVVVTVSSLPTPANPGGRLRETSAPGPSVPILAVWDAALRKALESGGAATISAHIPAPVIAPVKVRNVIGVLRGSDPVLKNTYLLVSAHYDHLGIRETGPGDRIYNGANDDASGTASAIEIANALAALPTRPKRSIVFLAFFGEELGEIGSQYYTRHPVFPLAATVADVNLEQLGRTDDSEGPHVGMFNLTGFDFTDLPAFFRRAAAETGIRVVKDGKNSDYYFPASDNLPFAEVGVPATTVSVSYQFPDYHQPGDEWPKLDYANMEKVDVAIALGVYAIADGLSAPEWNAANPQTEAFVKARRTLKRE
jgi:hypothetical protein